MFFNNTNRLPLAAACCSTILCINTSLADLEEIIVSSQWREQSLSETTLSVTALNTDTIDQRNIVDLLTLEQTVPSLNVVAFGTNYVSYTVRGITTAEPSPQSAPRIAVYLNGADISRNRSSHTELYDIDRIEVIKGPQASLFGTTAAAGAIAVYTNTPQQRKEVGINLGLGSNNRSDINAFVTGGSSIWQGRIAASSRSRDGYQDSNNSRIGRYGSIHRQSIRPSIRWLPNDDWQIDAVYTGERSNEINAAEKSATIAPPNGDTSPYTFAATSGNPKPDPLFPAIGLKTKRETQDFNLTVKRDLGNWQFTAITAYREFDVLSPFDGDGSQAWALEILDQSQGERQSQEFRFSKTTDNTHLLLGVSYLNEDLQRHNAFAADEGTYMLCVPLARAAFANIAANLAQTNPSAAPLAAALAANGLPCANEDGSINSLSPLATNGLVSTIPYYLQYTDYGDNDSTSVYADYSWDITSRLQLNVGARYINETRESGFSSYVPNALLTGGQFPLQLLQNTNGDIISADNSDDDVLLRSSVRFEWSPDHYFYTTYSEGRRSAVTDISAILDGNFQATANPVEQIPAEKLKNYEIGLKGGTSTFNYSAAVFYQDYSNYQVAFLNAAAGGQLTVQSLGETTNTGMEIEFNWQLNDALTLFGNASHIDNTFDNTVNNQSFAGKQLVHTPATTAVVGGEFTTAVAAHKLTANVFGSYKSAQSFDPQRQPLEPFTGLSLQQEAYTTWHANVMVDLSDAVRLKLWVNNLTDEHYLLDASTIGSNLGMPTYTPGEPRMWGIDMNVSL